MNTIIETDNGVGFELWLSPEDANEALALQKLEVALCLDIKGPEVFFETSDLAHGGEHLYICFGNPEEASD